MLLTLPIKKARRLQPAGSRAGISLDPEFPKPLVEKCAVNRVNKMENSLNWLDAVERLGLSGVLLTLIILTVKHYIGPWFSSFVESHNNLVEKLGEAIEKQDNRGQTQTELLEQGTRMQTELLKQMVEQDNYYREMIRNLKDGIARLENK